MSSTQTKSPNASTTLQKFYIQKQWDYERFCCSGKHSTKRHANTEVFYKILKLKEVKSVFIFSPSPSESDIR